MLFPHLIHMCSYYIVNIVNIISPQVIRSAYAPCERRQRVYDPYTIMLIIANIVILWYKDRSIIILTHHML